MVQAIRRFRRPKNGGEQKHEQRTPPSGGERQHRKEAIMTNSQTQTTAAQPCTCPANQHGIEDLCDPCLTEYFLHLDSYLEAMAA
jgi:hypothetical protein